MSRVCGMADFKHIVDTTGTLTIYRTFSKVENGCCDKLLHIMPPQFVKNVLSMFSNFTLFPSISHDYSGSPSLTFLDALQV